MAASDEQLDTKSLFNIHFVAWRILGMFPPQRLRPLYWLYSVSMNVIFVVGFPLHLLLGLFQSTTMYEVMQNLAINITCMVCLVKTYAIWWRFQRIGGMFDIIRRQDERIRSPEELKYLRNKVYRLVRGIIKFFIVVCSTVSLTSELSVLLNGLLGNWRLAYEAYFPFNPLGSAWQYFVAHIYQYIGLNCTIVQNLVNDSFAATHLALLGGQVHMLGMRLAKIGYDPQKSQAYNNLALVECIQAHQDLLDYHAQLEAVISLYIFFQILLSSINICTVMVFTVLFVQDPFTLVYYLSMLIGLFVEILPSCYYGTELEQEFHNLTYAVFSCDWMDQNLEFKKNLRIFAERASRKIHITAWIFHLNNESFIIAYKNTYSLFALIMNMK